MALLVRLGLAMLLGGFAAGVCAAENLALYEQKIKVGLLYNFLKYTEWPPAMQQSGSIDVCIFGRDPFDGNLQSMAEQTVHQRQISIRTVKSVDETNGCHLLFVASAEESSWPAWRDALTGKTLLTVGDFKKFVYQGGMVGFVSKDSRVNVEINLEAVGAAQLKVEDRLLSLASAVHTPANR